MISPRRSSARVQVDRYVGDASRSRSDAVAVEEPLEIRVVAERAGTWLRHPEPAVRDLVLKVRFTPPELQVLFKPTYLAPGSSEVVVFGHR